MQVSGGQLSLFGRAALSNVGGSRSSLRPALDPVQQGDPLKDATSSEYRALQDLKQRDREVRQHEQAHIAVGGAYVRGGASYQYQRGPDGRQYATGGEVQIDTTPIPDDPAATILKMQVVKRAALAPAEPSGQDRAVAAQATRAEADARAQLREQQQAEQQGGESAQESPSVRARDALKAYQGAQGVTETTTASLLDLVA